MSVLRDRDFRRLFGAAAMLAVPEIRSLPAFPPERGQLGTRRTAAGETAVSHTRGG